MSPCSVGPVHAAAAGAAQPRTTRAITAYLADGCKAGTRRAIQSAVAAASARRVDEVVAADPLAPSAARQAATYRAGVRRMTRAYEDAVAKWS